MPGVALWGIKVPSPSPVSPRTPCTAEEEEGRSAQRGPALHHPAVHPGGCAGEAPVRAPTGFLSWCPHTPLLWAFPFHPFGPLRYLLLRISSVSYIGSPNAFPLMDANAFLSIFLLRPLPFILSTAVVSLQHPQPGPLGSASSQQCPVSGCPPTPVLLGGPKFPCYPFLRPEPWSLHEQVSQVKLEE